VAELGSPHGVRGFIHIGEDARLGRSVWFVRGLSIVKLLMIGRNCMRRATPSCGTTPCLSRASSCPAGACVGVRMLHGSVYAHATNRICSRCCTEIRCGAAVCVVAERDTDPSTSPAWHTCPLLCVTMALGYVIARIGHKLSHVLWRWVLWCPTSAACSFLSPRSHRRFPCLAPVREVRLCRQQSS